MRIYKSFVKGMQEIRLLTKQLLHTHISKQSDLSWYFLFTHKKKKKDSTGDSPPWYGNSHGVVAGERSFFR